MAHVKVTLLLLPNGNLHITGLPSVLSADLGLGLGLEHALSGGKTLMQTVTPKLQLPDNIVTLLDTPMNIKDNKKKAKKLAAKNKKLAEEDAK